MSNSALIQYVLAREHADDTLTIDDGQMAYARIAKEMPIRVSALPTLGA